MGQVGSLWMVHSIVSVNSILREINMPQTKGVVMVNKIWRKVHIQLIFHISYIEKDIKLLWPDLFIQHTSNSNLLLMMSIFNSSNNTLCNSISNQANPKHPRMLHIKDSNHMSLRSYLHNSRHSNLRQSFSSHPTQPVRTLW